MESICEVCIEEGTVCESCREGLEEDMEEDILEVSEFIESLKEEYSYLEDVDIKRIYTCGKVLVIVTPAEDVGKVVGRGGEIVKKLADEWNRSIRVVEYNEDPKKFARDLLPNVDIYSINQVFAPEGEYYKALVDDGKEDKVILSRDEFSYIVEDVTGELMELKFT